MYCFLVEPFPSKPSPQLMLQLCHAVQSLYLSDSTTFVQRPGPVQQAGNMTRSALQEMNQINLQMRLSGHLLLNLLGFFEMKNFNLPRCSWMFGNFEFRTNNLLDTQPGRASQRAVAANPFMNHKGSLFSRMDSQIGDFCQITCQATCSQSRSSEDAPVQSSVQ